MKKHLNVIQINGIRGLILTVMIGCCLAAGFIVFPGWVSMHVWNFLFAYINAQYYTTVPQIGLIPGILLWGIIVTSYFIFKKNRLIVCFRTPEGLSEDELKSVFEEMKGQAKEEMIVKSMLKAREAELRLKDAEKTNEIENKEETDSTFINHE